MAQFDVAPARDRQIDSLTSSRAEKSSVETFKHAQCSGRLVYLIQAGIPRCVGELYGSRPVFTPNTVIVHGESLAFRKFSKKVMLEDFPISMPLYDPCTAH